MVTGNLWPVLLWPARYTSRMTQPWDRDTHSDAECALLIDRFLLEPDRLIDLLAPDGWERSPLFAAFSRGDDLDDEAGGAEPALDTDTDSHRAIIELVGAALWDIFSDNHSVVDTVGKAYDLGSFRGAAGFIAERMNRRYDHRGHDYDYIDFYMGARLWRANDQLRPVYRWIFQELRAAGCVWEYSFPRIYMVDLGDRSRADDVIPRDPSEAVRAEIEDGGQTNTADSLREQLDRLYEDEVRRARDAPLPATVAAHVDVYGELPEGWPWR
jgi:hypothetical protein